MTSPRSFLLCLTILATLQHVSARDIQVNTDPTGARIEVVNVGNTRMRSGSVFEGPAVVDFPRRRDEYVVEVSAPGYEPVRFVYDFYNTDARSFDITLPPLEASKRFSFRSDPAGAAVFIDGEQVGQTPLAREITFSRSDSQSPWSEARARLSLPDHEGQAFTLTKDSSGTLPTVELPLLRDVVNFRIQTSSGGQPLPGAEVQVGGEIVGQTPMDLALEFSRASGGAPWSVAETAVGIPDEFVFQEFTLDRGSERNLRLDLAPVTEVAVTKYFPTIEFTVRGPKLTLDESTAVGVLNPRDLSTPYSDLRKVTNFSRGQSLLNALNAFTLTPDGQMLVYAVTMDNGDGSYYSNLFMKEASDQSFSFLQITRGNQFLDTNPTTAIDPDSDLVVFQSNRLGRRDSWDISAVRVQDGRVVGGVLQLTHEPRFNFRPSILSENRPAFFIGHDDYPAAQPYVSSIRLDGSSYTVLGEVAEEVVYTQSGKLYLVRAMVDSGVKQIYSITAEGLTFSTVINDAEFSRANCFNPAISPDGSKMIFVSDYARDSKDRQNNNLFVLDFATSRIQQITDNGSDDIAPEWSPTDPNVVFFLSNREGVYNVWRMELVVGN